MHALYACEKRILASSISGLAAIYQFLLSLCSLLEQTMSLLLQLPLDIVYVIVDLLDLQSQMMLSETCEYLNTLIFIRPRVITVLSYDNNIIKPLLYQQILVLGLYSYPKYCRYFKKKNVEARYSKQITVVKVSSRGNVVEQLKD